MRQNPFNFRFIVFKFIAISINSIQLCGEEEIDGENESVKRKENEKRKNKREKRESGRVVEKKEG